MSHAPTRTIGFGSGERRAPSSVTLLVRLQCYIEKEDDVWVAGCPRLDVYSQGDSDRDARASIEEAVKLWFESCLERNTLEKALIELGFRPVPPSQIDKGDEVVALVEEPPAEILGDPFDIDITIPAYQAAMFSDKYPGLTA